MKLKGIKTSTENVEIEITLREVFEKLANEIAAKVGYSYGHDHIEKGKLFKLEGYDHHNGDPDYYPPIEATEKQIQVDEALDTIRRLVYE